MRAFRKARFIWVYPLALWLFATASTSEPSLRLGAVVMLLGEALRLWANGYVGHVKVNRAPRDTPAAKTGRLITAGPYAFVRNPLYVGSFLIVLGFCVAMRSPLAALAAWICFAILYGEKTRREESLIQDEWGREYAAYRAAVPRWMPTWRRYPHREGRWTWEGIAASKELKTVVWVTVGFLAVYFREEIFQEHEWWTPAVRAKQAGWLILAAVLILGDGLFEFVGWQQRRAKRG